MDDSLVERRIHSSPIDYFPGEVWENILQSPILTAKDICSLAKVSRRLHSLTASQTLWKIKFRKCWPVLYDDIQSWPCSSFLEADISMDDWSQLYRLRYQLDGYIRARLIEFSEENLGRESLLVSDSRFESFGSESLVKSRFTIDAIHQILTSKERNDNLTQCFYGAQLCRYLCQKIVADEINAWMENPVCLEKAAFMMASWFQTGESLNYRDLSDFLDRMANDVKARISKLRPRHPILNAGLCKEQELEESWWSGEDCRSLLEALGYIFAVDYQFNGNSEDYYNPNNSFINKVTETRKGIPLTLSIVYQAVAKRLGVRVDLVNFPSHMLLKFLEHPELQDDERYTYVDAFVNPEHLMNQAEIYQAKARLFHGSHAIPRDQAIFDTATPLMVIRRMWNNLCRVDERHIAVTKDTLSSAYKLGVILCPWDMHVRFMLARYYISNDINYNEVIKLMTEMVIPDNNAVMETQRQHYIETAKECMQEESWAGKNKKELVVKRRSKDPHVKWAVGQIMRHKKYGYTCVINGWDPKCQAGELWIKEMGVRDGSLDRADKQPFYHVLVSDETSRYAAEDNLITEPEPKPVTHAAVGKYFEKYCGGHYRMNPELLAAYPEDLKVAFEYSMKHHSNITLL